RETTRWMTTRTTTKSRYTHGSLLRVCLRLLHSVPRRNNGLLTPCSASRRPRQRRRHDTSRTRRTGHDDTSRYVERNQKRRTVRSGPAERRLLSDTVPSRFAEATRRQSWRTVRASSLGSHAERLR